MAVHFVLDGYNIIKQVPQLANEKLEASRAGLIRLIEVNRPHGSSKNQVTIVFDGKSGVGGYSYDSPVKVIFSSDESADEKIKRLVSGITNRKNVIVVTNDRAIQYFVRALGAKVLSVDEFLSGGTPAHKKTRPVKGTAPKEQKTISKTLEHKINTEMETIWLEKKRKGKDSP